MSDQPAIKTENLGRIYKIRGAKKGEARQRVALADVNLEVPRGEFFGLLGPNGAGKTTLIKILTTLLAPSTGRAFVAGYDVARQPQEVRPRINMVSGGESSGYGLLTVRENLWMFGQFYGLDTKTTYARIDELLQIVGLADRARTKTSDLSTGLRQKMNIVRGFLTDPEVIFLDEPTLGLDVGASRDIRHFVRRWMDDRPGRTVLLTTHYMVEADELCDRVAIINNGRVLACDSPANLKRRLQREAIFKLEVSPLRNGVLAAFEQLPGVRKVVHSPQDGRSELDLILEADEALGGVVTALNTHGAHILNLQKREPTLEDVFVDLVGMSMTEAEKAGEQELMGG
ncbi:MAG: ABC transporter ATP-binding protein [Anaerolineales bacterium]|nr:ABC transporter ATP-binding protein [Anaerolineales bacterium]